MSDPLAEPVAGIYAVVVRLVKGEGANTTLSYTLSHKWQPSEDRALVDAVKYAREMKPGFAIDEWLINCIPCAEPLK